MATVDLPQDFVKEIRTYFDTEQEYQEFLSSFQKARTYGLRRNPLRYEKEDFEQSMPLRLRPIPWARDGYYYDPEEQPGKLPFHEAGDYYIQDPSAMAVVEILDPKPGEMICDLCAAPGGKSSQIAGKLMGEGLLVCNEYVPKRAQILAQNMERMGVVNCIVFNEDTEKLSSGLLNFFDRIVIDAPCSGEGMFRKDDVAVKNWSLENIAICAKRQLEILENGAAMLRDGGVLVYSTCTFSEAENEQVIAAFLKKHPEFEPDLKVPNHSMLEWGFQAGKIPGTVRLWPHKIEGEGHFIARLLKKNSDAQENEVRNSRRDTEWKKSGKQREKYGKGHEKDKNHIFYEFCEELFTKEYMNTLRNRGTLVWKGEQLYLIPTGMPDLQGFKVEKPGLHLGTAKRNRFEPSHTWAMTLSPDKVNQVVALKNPIPFLRGESVPCGEEKGWTLVVIQNEPLGWGKASDSMLKNHYPKGLRRDMS